MRNLMNGIKRLKIHVSERGEWEMRPNERERMRDICEWGEERE